MSTPNFLEFDNLPAGDYTLTITDANCPYDIIRNFTLTEPTVLSGLATLTSDPIDCFGETETYDITASGGVPPYTGTGSYTFAAGTNSVIITDANGCSTTVQVTVVEPPVLSATATIINPIPCFGETATIEVVAAGGTPPYTGDGMFTVSTGIFVYTVTDGNNCTYTDSIHMHIINITRKQYIRSICGSGQLLPALLELRPRGWAALQPRGGVCPARAGGTEYRSRMFK